jgi:hypothetical protein
LFRPAVRCCRSIEFERDRDSRNRSGCKWKEADQTIEFHCGENRSETLIEQIFRSRFADWSIELPSADVTNRRRGKIIQAGWVIWYLFGTNEKGEYLDYYASHRMTNDSHVRIYASGETEELSAIRDFRFASDDPEEDRRLEREYFAENQRIAKLLEEKGFAFSGDEPRLMIINRFLHVKKLDSKKKE